MEEGEEAAEQGGWSSGLEWGDGVELLSSGGAAALLSRGGKKVVDRERALRPCHNCPMVSPATLGRKLTVFKENSSKTHSEIQKVTLPVK